VPHLAGPSTNLFAHRQELLAHEDGHGVRVVEDVRDLFGHQPVIHRRRDEPGRAGAGAGQVVLERVPGVDDGVLTGLEPKLDQGVAQPIAPLDQAGPGPDALSLDEGGPVGVAGGMGSQDVHRARS
jgi:hypothetical protein